MEQGMQTVIAQGAGLALRIAAGAVIFAAFWLGALLAQALLRRRLRRSEARTDLAVFLGRVLRAAWLIFGAVTALGTMGVNVSALVAGLGLTGFALGFAMRDWLSNALAGILIMFYRPFSLFDRIVVTGFEGRVINLNLRYTVLEQDGRRYLIPNAMLFTNTVTVLQSETPAAAAAAPQAYASAGR